MEQKTQWYLLKNPVHFFSLGAGTGLLPKMPGTFGSLLALPLFVPFASLPLPILLAMNAVFFVLGCICCDKTAQVLGGDDPSPVVLDEIVAMFLVLSFTTLSLPHYFIAFLLFRAFDIFKPWPIRECEKKYKGGFGIMFDDFIAAGYTIIIMIGTPLIF